MEKVQEFTPTSSMRLYAAALANLDYKKQSKIAKQIGVRTETISRWKHIEGFSDWLEVQCTAKRVPIATLLQQIGIEKALAGDFRYWGKLVDIYCLPQAEIATRTLMLSYNLEGKVD